MDRAADRDGPAAAQLRAPGGDPGAAGLDPGPRAPGPRPHPGWQRLEKLLEGALVKLSSVVSKLAGNKTARAVIEALIGGERDPARLADLALTRLRGRRADLQRSLEGMAFGAHHARLARMLLDRIDVPGPGRRRPRRRDRRLPGRHPRRRGRDRGRGPVHRPRAGRRRAARRGPARGDPRRHRQPRDARSSPRPGWTCPGSRPPPTWSPGPAWPPPPASPEPGPASPPKARATATCAATAPRPPTGPPATGTFLGERLRRLSRRLGGARARCAVGRSILIIIWHLLNDPAARYADLGPGWHARKTDRDKKIQGHLRQLQALGLKVTITQAAA